MVEVAGTNHSMPKKIVQNKKAKRTQQWTPATLTHSRTQLQIAPTKVTKRSRPSDERSSQQNKRPQKMPDPLHVLLEHADRRHGFAIEATETSDEDGNEDSVRSEKESRIPGLVFHGQKGGRHRDAMRVTDEEATAVVLTASMSDEARWEIEDEALRVKQAEGTAALQALAALDAVEHLPSDDVNSTAIVGHRVDGWLAGHAAEHAEPVSPALSFGPALPGLPWDEEEKKRLRKLIISEGTGVSILIRPANPKRWSP